MAPLSWIQGDDNVCQIVFTDKVSQRSLNDLMIEDYAQTGV